MRFHATLLASGKTATGFQVPDDVVAALGAGKRPAVRVTIEGHTYRSSVASMGGVFMVGVSAENRAAAGVSAGDELEVDIELDAEPRLVTVPSDLAKALRGAPDAKAIFDGLSYSRKSRQVLSVEGAKTPETRARRVDKVIVDLREGKA